MTTHSHYTDMAPDSRRTVGCTVNDDLVDEQNPGEYAIVDFRAIRGDVRSYIENNTIESDVEAEQVMSLAF